MKTLHVPFTFHPDPAGGTEVYVTALAKALAEAGHPAVIAAPAAADDRYTYEGLTVHRFGVPAARDLAELYGQGDTAAARAFGAILDFEHPDVVHLHAFTRGASLRVVREAGARRIPVVLTWHTPTVSCTRGTLMQWGHSPCDGIMQAARCAACTLQGLGAPRALAEVAARIPPAIARRIAPMADGTDVSTALRLPALIGERHRHTRELFDRVERILVFRDWTAALLASNGVPAGKIVRTRHALCHDLREENLSTETMPSTRGDFARGGAMRVAFLGRAGNEKGLETLVRAFRLQPSMRVTLDAYLVAGESRDDAIEELRRQSGGDPRIALHAAVAPGAVVPLLRGYDLVAVPSVWMETGPLVVLEAFAAGTPVIGSDLGGIAESVRDDEDGVLVSDYRSPEAWAAAIAGLAASPETVERLRAGVRPPPGIAATARQMLGVYADVAGAAAARVQALPHAHTA